MIQLYIPSNTNYSSNGNITLLPGSADISVVLNGSWSASLNHPIDPEGRWKYIEEEAVIKMPSFNGEQLFRIKRLTKKDSGVECTLEPIFYDSIDDCMILDVRPTNKTGQEALDIVTAINTKYSGSSNISKVSTAYYQHKNLIEVINGDDENAFIKRWGGEVLYDNYKVIINNRIGGDYGVQVVYGKNIPKDGLKEEIDIRDVVTRIYPKSYNGHTLTGDYVDSPLINVYPTVKTGVIKFEDVKMLTDAQEGDSEKGIIICNTQAELDEALTKKCQEQFALGIDKPTVTIALEMVLLQNTELYKDFKQVEAVSLGDTIHCKHNKLGIITDARVIELKYDAIRKKVSSLKIGDFQNNALEQVSSYMNQIESVIAPNGTVMADRVAGILNGIQTQLRYQKNIAQRQDVRAILFEDTDPESPIYGALAIGTQGLQIANKRTADNRDWDWTTAFTANGGYADAIILGTLSDKLGKNFWNLDTGEFSLSSAATVGGKTVNAIAKEAGESAAGDAVKAQTQEDIFNKLTNNGALKGIYMKNGVLHINFDYAFGGTLKLGGVNNERGLMEILDANNRVIGSIDNSSFAIQIVTIGDRVLIYNSDKSAECSIGFEPGTNTLYISGTNVKVNIPALISASATITELNATNVTASGNIQGNVLKAIVSMYSPYYSGTDMYLEKNLTADGDVITAGVSLKNHTHMMIVGDRHSLVMNYVGGSYLVPMKADGKTSDTGAVSLGGNNNKFKAVYATDGTIQTSDEREKDIIGKLDERHRKLLRELKPIIYKWKKDGKELHAGFGAQTTEKAMRNCSIAPEEQFCIRYEEGSYSMNYDELIPVIVDALQDTINRIDRLEGKEE